MSLNFSFKRLFRDWSDSLWNIIPQSGSKSRKWYMDIQKHYAFTNTNFLLLKPVVACWPCHTDEAQQGRNNCPWLLTFRLTNIYGWLEGNALYQHCLSAHISGFNLPTSTNVLSILIIIFNKHHSLTTSYYHVAQMYLLENKLIITDVEGVLEGDYGISEVWVQIQLRAL